MVRRRPRFDAGKEVRAIARERVGQVPPARVIEDKTLRKVTKHKKRLDVEDASE